mmetsp:Transcript_3401/g.9255  ORF Transcript_3401/g.9255 Transcript_3401/m.9255 type:complete len:238 (-) Transcript_3401:172-885(-)
MPEHSSTKPTASITVWLRGRPRKQRSQNTRETPSTAPTTDVTSWFCFALDNMRPSACLAEDSSLPMVRMFVRMPLMTSRCAERSRITPWLTSSVSKACRAASSSCCVLRSKSSVLLMAPFRPALEASSRPPPTTSRPSSRRVRRPWSSLKASSSPRKLATSRAHSWSRWSHSCFTPPALPESSSLNCTWTWRRVDSMASSARSAARASSAHLLPPADSRRARTLASATARKRAKSVE